MKQENKDRSFCLVCNSRRLQTNMRKTPLGYVCKDVCIIDENSWLYHQQQLALSIAKTQAAIKKANIKFHKQTKMKLS